MAPMTVLMFGWEFPPHISGGLGTACYGLTKALVEENTQLLFVVPRAQGDEEIPLINASDIYVREFTELEKSVTTKQVFGEKALKIHIESTLKPYPDDFTGDFDSIQSWNYEFREERSKEVTSNKGTKYLFTGLYGTTLLDEVNRYGNVAREIAQSHSFDVIHAHDWLTFPAGIEAKKISGKPLVIHVHATEFDRAGEQNINQRVFDIEKSGMMESDKIIAVSHWTKDILIKKYGISEEKISVIHNGVTPQTESDFSYLPKISKHIVTFLGRITYQKGPQYFIEAARKVLSQFPDAHFVMAGSGDLLPEMMMRVARAKISSRFHFTGFLKGEQIHQLWSVTDVYVMPSVSEPFGITPLEAIQAHVPVIVSNQSGVAEVMKHAIKVDFWDTDALANAIMSVLNHQPLSNSLKINSGRELKTLTWNRAAKKVNTLYEELQQNY